MVEASVQTLEQQRQSVEILKGISSSVRELADLLAELNASVAKMERRNEAREILSRLVQRGTITRDEMERAMDDGEASEPNDEKTRQDRTGRCGNGDPHEDPSRTT